MSKYEPKPGSFSLFRNDKEGNEARPDYTGTGMDLESNPIRVSAWLKEGKNGKFMSCRLEPQKSANVPKQAPKKQEPVKAIDESDLPFN